MQVDLELELDHTLGSHLSLHKVLKVGLGHEEQLEPVVQPGCMRTTRYPPFILLPFLCTPPRNSFAALLPPKFIPDLVHVAA